MVVVVVVMMGTDAHTIFCWVNILFLMLNSRDPALIAVGSL